MTRTWMLAMLGTILLAAPLRADEKTAKTEAEAPKATDPSKPFEAKGQESQVTKVAAKYNVTEAEVRSMRTSGKGMGWGEIGHALAISEKSGQPLAEILKLRDSGMGWGQIAKKYDFKLGAVSRKAGEIKKDGEKAEKADAKADKMDKAGKSSGASDKGDAGRSGGSDHKGGHGGSQGGSHGGGHRK